MVQIKGSSVLETVQAIKKRVGDAAYDKIVSLLNDEAKKMFQAEIFSSTWYPLDAFAHFLEVEIKVLANGNEEVIIRGAELVAERQLGGIYKVFVKLGSPEFVIKRISAVHATYFQGVLVEFEMLGPCKAMIKYTGFERQHRLLGYAIIGFFRKALALSGAKGVVAEFATLIDEGKGYAELVLTWR
jgi:hypothetical protein